MYSSYSPLFKLGLLAEHAPAPSRSPTSPVDDVAEAIYFTLRPRKRNSAELRSFLYLDLADRKRKSPFHRRKPSTLSKASSWTCTADTKSFNFARTDKPLLAPPVPMVPARRRTSKESLRNIPSPKPAPSATLPDLPLPSDPRPLLTFSPPSSLKRPASTVISSPLSPTLRARRPASLRSESISSHDRRKSRMDALACLEGRSRGPNRVSRASTLRNNFMSFSDDEDGNSMIHKSVAPTLPMIQSEDLSAFADVEDEVEAIIPLARKREAAPQAKSVRPTKHARKRRSTIDSWFPLKSFIDFKDDDLSTWNWRSFIEIGGVA